MKKRKDFLPFSPPSIADAEIDAVTRTLRSGWITTGPQTKLFEERFAALVGAKDALAVSSCTAALHLALLVADVQPGQKVMMPTMTFVSAAHVVEHLGATPVFVDVEHETLNVDPLAIEATLTPDVAAVVPVHLYGHPAELNAILDLAGPQRFVIEDAAHALPARYRGRTIGGSVSSNVLSCFSFYATKNLTTGEGGMLTGAPELLEEARVWSLHGIGKDAWKRYSSTGSWFYEVDRPGFKYNMTDLQAALGLTQLERLSSMQDRRRAISARYGDQLSDIEAVEVPTARDHVDSALHLYVIRLNLEQLSIDRARFVEEMKERNIGTSVHFIPLHMQPYYRDRYGLKAEDFPIASREFQRILSLPLNPTMTDDDVDDVVDAVRDITSEYRR